MQSENHDHWSALSERLRQDIPSAGFDAWIRPVRGEWDGSALHLKVPSRFFLDGLKSLYGKKIVNAAIAVFGGEPAVLYEVDTSLGFTQAGVQAEEKGNSQVDGYIDPRFTFDNFVVGSSNEFCYAACQAVVQRPGESYNPLYIHGGVGLGKTHLINAVANALIKKNHYRIAYRTSERFTNELISAIKNNATQQFRDLYRRADILIIDDVQFIAGKSSTQEEFFHTFNALHELHKQIILTSDRSPREINHLEERLRSRFNWGLVADIQPPDLETRLAILARKAELAGVTLGKDVSYLLASRITNNVRELEGALNRIVAHATLVGRPITIESAQEVLHDVLRASDRRVSIEEIQKRVAEHYRIRTSDMHSARRARAVARPRQVAMYLAKQLTSRSLPEIGRKFGGRDHTTVMHAVRKVEELRKLDSGFCEDVDLLRRMLES